MQRGTYSSKRPWEYVVGASAFIVLLFLWEVACRMGLIEAIFLPAPSQICARALRMAGQGTLLEHIIASGRRVMVGFLLAALAAVPFGIFLGTSRFFMAISLGMCLWGRVWTTCGRVCASVLALYISLQNAIFSIFLCFLDFR